MAYGFSNMMVFGSGPFRIFEHVRNISSRISEHFGSLFTCMMCFPANLGWVFSVIDWFLIKNVAITPFNILLAGTGMWWLALVLDCFFTSGIVWLIHNFESFFENIVGNSESEDNNDVLNVHE
jgi:hypothetical protein